MSRRAVVAASGADLASQEQARLVELETVVERGLRTFVEVGEALKEIRDQRLYRQHFGTFEQYVAERWGWKRRQAYALMESAKVARNVQTSAQLGYGQAQALAPLSAEEQRQLAEAVGGLTVSETREAVRAFNAAKAADGVEAAEAARERWAQLESIAEDADLHLRLAGEGRLALAERLEAIDQLQGGREVQLLACAEIIGEADRWIRLSRVKQYRLERALGAILLAEPDLCAWFEGRKHRPKAPA